MWQGLVYYVASSWCQKVSLLSLSINQSTSTHARNQQKWLAEQIAAWRVRIICLKFVQKCTRTSFRKHTGIEINRKFRERNLELEMTVEARRPRWRLITICNTFGGGQKYRHRKLQGIPDRDVGRFYPGQRQRRSRRFDHSRSDASSICCCCCCWWWWCWTAIVLFMTSLDVGLHRHV